MIREIYISNFQSHKESCLELSPGVNAIIGDSDSGKSSIIRALNWLIHNKPNGDNFRSTWGGDTEVRIIDSDDNTICRAKTDSENKYLLNDQSFKALKTDVPEEIREVLDMNNVNIQTQLEPPFMFSLSSGEVARLLNKFANLTQIDNAIAYIRKEVSANNSEIDVLESSIRDYQKALDEFDYLNSMEKLIIKLESYVEEKEEIENSISDIEKTLKKIAMLLRDKVELESLLSIEDDVKKALALIEDENALETKIRDLEKRLCVIEKLEDGLQVNRDDLKRYKSEFKKLMPDKCPMCGK